MVLTIPDSLKIVTSYIRRAEELEKDTSSSDYRVVSYYCKKFALEQAIKLKLNEPEANKFITTVLIALEKDKPSLGISSDQAPVICENFACSVFTRADEEDRNGMASKTTAKIFYSAATFFDILEQFGELDHEMREKRKYCKWKAADILKAINEGRKPTPGGFEDMQEPVADNMMSMGGISLPEAPMINIPMPPSNAVFPPNNMSYGMPMLPPNIQQTMSPPINNSYPSPSPPAYNAYAQPPSYPASSASSSAPMHHHGMNNGINMMNLSPSTSQKMNRPAPNHVNDPRIKDAVEVCMFAVAALKTNDVPLAKARLQEALNRLNSS